MELKDLTPIITTFVLLGVLLAVGLTVMNSLQKSTAPTATYNYLNFTWSNETALSVEHLLTVVNITNQTGVLVASGNYSVTAFSGERGGNGTVTFLTNSTSNACFNGENCRMIYTYKNFDADAPTAMYASMTALSELPNNWFLIIIVVMIAGLIIGVLMESFGNKR